jgi:two-component system sensor histidine kinase HupT/HoxJ
MTLQFDLSFVLTHISTICSVIMLIFLIKRNTKKQISTIFIILIFLVVVWNISTIIESYIRQIHGYTEMVFVNINYFSICFIPVFIFLLGLIYSRTKIIFSYKIYLLFIIPVITTILIWTNDHHHLFFINYSIYSNEAIYGLYYYFHSIYSYSLIFIGLYYLFSASIRNSGFFSNQSKLILMGIIGPLAVNIIYSFNLLPLAFDINSVMFTFASACFALAIFRFDFLGVAPIALQTIVDRISDGFLVINEDYQVIDFNKTLSTTFRDVILIRRKETLENIMKGTGLANEYDALVSIIENARESRVPISFEKHIKEGDFDKHFRIEVTPIVSNNNYIGTIILFKDITENIRHIETIEEKHAIMMEQERLASLGQLIGGIAHNLNTPIMSIAGAVEGLRDLVDEYEESIGDDSVTDDDHHEIASEMRVWLEKIKPHCSYMSDIINAVKGQARHFNQSVELSFTVDELLKRIELLMKYELIRYNCTLKTFINVDRNTELYGDINSLVQIFDNIIINAIQAYEGKNGIIELSVKSSDSSILFAVRDYAKGIPKNIKDKLLKEMVTTKGKDGTGLGLFMSYSTIRGRFNGKMWFESEEGKGTTFFIQMPNDKLNKIHA